MFPGFATRFRNEICELYKEKALAKATTKEIKIKIEINDSPRRKISVFVGAAVLANTYNTERYDGYWITKPDWEELGGENAILKKCKNVVL